MGSDFCVEPARNTAELGAEDGVGSLSAMVLIGVTLTNKLEQLLRNQSFAKIVAWVGIALVFFIVFKLIDTRESWVAASLKYSELKSPELKYSEFLEEVQAKRIYSAVIQEGRNGTEIIAVTTKGRKVSTATAHLDQGLVRALISGGVKFDVKPREEEVSSLPDLVLLLFAGALALWFWALIDILKNDFNDGSAKISWLLATIFLPILGSFLYLSFGRKQKVLKA